MDKSRNVRSSTLEWMKQWTFNPDSEHESIVQQLESRKSSTGSTNMDDDSAANDNPLDPVNIICFDGGGARGAALLVMLEELSERIGKDILSYFHLAAGSSVGGMTALTCSYCYSNTKEVCRIGTKTSNCLRDGTLSKLNPLNLITRGTLEDKDSTFADVLFDLVGDEPLHNPGSPIKALALCTVRCPAAQQEDKGDPPSTPRSSGELSTFEPFVLRSYDIYRDTSEEESESLDVLQGTHEVKLWEALAATSAAPTLASRIDMTINGETRRYADGSVISNSPVAIAIKEAKTLWPARPLGVILSLGLGGRSEEELIGRAIEAIKVDQENAYPNLLHYCRLEPPNIENFSVIEKNVETTEKMKDGVRSYIQDSSKSADGDVSKLFVELNKQGKVTRKPRRHMKKSGNSMRSLFYKPKNRSIEEVNAKLERIAARKTC